MVDPESLRWTALSEAYNGDHRYRPVLTTEDRL